MIVGSIILRYVIDCSRFQVGLEGSSFCESLKKLLVLHEQLLILVDSMVDTTSINIAFSQIFSSLLSDLTVIEFKNVFVSLFEFCFHLEINHFGIVDTNWALACLLSYYLIN